MLLIQVYIISYLLGKGEGIFMIAIQNSPQECPDMQTAMRDKIINNPVALIEGVDLIGNYQGNNFLADILLGSLAKILRIRHFSAFIELSLKTLNCLNHQNIIGVRNQSLQNIIIVQIILSMAIALKIAIYLHRFHIVFIAA